MKAGGALSLWIGGVHPDCDDGITEIVGGSASESLEHTFCPRGTWCRDKPINAVESGSCWGGRVDRRVATSHMREAVKAVILSPKQNKLMSVQVSHFLSMR